MAEYNIEDHLDEYCKTKTIANLFGVSVRRVQQLTQEGIIDTEQTPKGRKYKLGPTVQKYVQYLSDKANGKAVSKEEEELKMQKLKAEVALKESQGDLHQLRMDIVSGKYISVEEVKLDYSRFFVSFKKFALSIPSKMAGKLSGFVDPVEVRQIENELQKDITKLLNSFVMSTEIEKKGSNGKA